MERSRARECRKKEEGSDAARAVQAEEVGRGAHDEIKLKIFDFTAFETVTRNVNDCWLCLVEVVTI